MSENVETVETEVLENSEEKETMKEKIANKFANLKSNQKFKAGLAIAGVATTAAVCYAAYKHHVNLDANGVVPFNDVVESVETATEVATEVAKTAEEIL